MVKLGDKAEKKRSKTLIFSIIVFAIICVATSYIKDKNSVNVYNIQDITDENALIFRNLKLVELGDNLYIEKGCTINIKEGISCDEIKNINIGCYIDNKEIYNSSIEKIEGSPVEFINMPTIIRKVRMNSNSILTMKISYLISGEEKEFEKDIILKDWTSECNVYN